MSESQNLAFTLFSIEMYRLERAPMPGLVAKVMRQDGHAVSDDEVSRWLQAWILLDYPNTLPSRKIRF